MVSNEDELHIDVFVGMDVGKTDHHAVALSVTGKVLLDRSLPQDEQRLRQLIVTLKAPGVVRRGSAGHDRGVAARGRPR